MKILITGVSGHLGHEIWGNLTAKNKHEIYGTYLTRTPKINNSKNIFKVDLANGSNVFSLIKKISPDFVVHCAAISSVEFCEANKGIAWGSNVVATKNVSEACKISNSRMIFISTDYVFDGEKGLYKENDITNPINFYGKTKLIGEWITAALPDSVVLRTTTLLSHWKGGYVNNILNELKSKKAVYGAKDMISSPTLTSELAEAISKLLYMKIYGFSLYHMSGSTKISRYNLAKKLIQAFGYDHKAVKPTTSKGLGFKAPRPRDTSLDISRAKSKNFKFSKIDDAIRKLRYSHETSNRNRI